MMDTGLTDAQKELHQYMSDISEFAYFARWMTGTEYRLWGFMTDANDNGDWGRDAALTVDMRAELFRLSETIGGWIHWVSAVERAESGPQFITTTDWQKKYARWASELALAKKHLPRRYVDYSESDGLAYWAALQELDKDDEDKG